MFKLHLTRQRLRLSFKTGDVGSLSLNKKSLVKWIWLKNDWKAMQHLISGAERRRYNEGPESHLG